MELKVLLNIIRIWIVKVLLPTYDVYGDYYIVYQLMVGNCFAKGQQGTEGYTENHVYIGMIAIIPLLLSFLFHLVHWWEMEKVENGGHGRLLTLPLIILQVWPQYRYIMVCNHCYDNQMKTILSQIISDLTVFLLFEGCLSSLEDQGSRLSDK